MATTQKRRNKPTIEEIFEQIRKEEQCLNLLAMGNQVSTVVAHLVAEYGVHHSTAYRWLKSALGRKLDRHGDKAVATRAILRARYEYAVRKLQPKVDLGTISAVQVWINLGRAVAELEGASMPQKIDVTTQPKPMKTKIFVGISEEELRGE
jgi:hypothetical protein